MGWKITLSDVCLLCRLKVRSLFLYFPFPHPLDLDHSPLFYGRRHIWIDVCFPVKGWEAEGVAWGLCVCRQCPLSLACNFKQAVSVIGLAALRRQLRLSFTIIIQVLFQFSLPLLRQGQPWLIWAICCTDYERRGRPASAAHMLFRSTHIHTHTIPLLLALFQDLSYLSAVRRNCTESW